MNIVKKIVGKEDENRNGSEKGEQYDYFLEFVISGGIVFSEIEFKYKYKVVIFVGYEEFEEN